VALGERIVLGGDQHHTVPELLLGRVVTETVDEVLGAPDVAAHAAERLLVVAEEQVGPVTFGLWPL